MWRASRFAAAVRVASVVVRSGPVRGGAHGVRGVRVAWLPLSVGGDGPHTLAVMKNNVAVFVYSSL